MEHPRRTSLPVIDWGSFAEHLRACIEARGQSFRDLADELGGITFASLQRICSGRPCSAEVYLWLCTEFRINPLRFYRPPPS